MGAAQTGLLDPLDLNGLDFTVHRVDGVPHY